MEYNKTIKPTEPLLNEINSKDHQKSQKRQPDYTEDPQIEESGETEKTAGYITYPYDGQSKKYQTQPYEIITLEYGWGILFYNSTIHIMEPDSDILGNREIYNRHIIDREYLDIYHTPEKGIDLIEFLKDCTGKTKIELYRILDQKIQKIQDEVDNFYIRAKATEITLEDKDTEWFLIGVGRYN